MSHPLKKISHLVIIAPAFAHNEEDGIIIPPLQLYLAELTNKYPDLIVSVIALHFPFTKIPYRFNNCSVYPMNGHNGFVLFRPYIWLKTLSRLKKIHRETPIDCIHSFWYNEPALLGERMAKQIDVPHLSTLMGQDAKKDNTYLKLIRSKSMSRVTLSAFQKKVFESHSKYKINEIIPFGISDLDGDLWQLKPEERSLDLICVSSLIPLKQVHLFISLVAGIKTKIPDIKAIVVGDGIFKKIIEDHIKHFELEDNVKLLGKLPRKECLEWMNKSKILVHTSEYEGQGYVLNEALALGCKVAALSTSLEIENDHYYIAPDLQKLVTQVYEWLIDEAVEYESQVPVKMSDTVSNYEQLLQISGVSFK
jgi:glycosyltransferase involved in cell wall biosynthesis